MVGVGMLVVTFDHWRSGIVIIGLALIGRRRPAAAPAGPAGGLPRRPQPAGGRRPAGRYRARPHRDRAADPLPLTPSGARGALGDRLAAMAEKPRSGKVTVVGAGFYGSTTALRLAEYDVFETVVLTDIVEGKPEGIALDMNQSRPDRGLRDQDRRRRRRLLRGHRGLRRRRDHRRPAAQAGHEPDGPHRDQREDRAPGRGEHRADLARRRDHRRLQPARRDDGAGAAGHRLPEEPGHGPGGHARHRPLHQQRRRGARRPGLRR